MNRIEIITVFVFSFVFILFSVNFVNADKPTFSITIDSPTGGSVLNPVQVSGNVSAINFPGNLTQYSVRINWGDGNIIDLSQDGAHLILIESGKNFNGTYRTTTDLSHNYTPGSYTIESTLCHQSCTGAEGSVANATVNIIVVVPTCGITASPNPNFGTINPGVTSGDQYTNVTNTGTVPTSSLTINGTDWVSGINVMDVTRTHWSLLSGRDYDTQMTTLTTGEVSLEQNVNGNGGTLPVYFKLRIPPGQVQGSYSQTITFTSGC